MKTLTTVSHGLKFRWINGQCFEFKFNNGKTLLTDPWYSLDFPDHPLAKVCPPDFTVENLEGGDYVFLNHTHVDHIYNLQEVYNRFKSTVITHSATAVELAEAFDIPLTSIYPVDFEGSYYFDGFRIDTHHGTHHEQKHTLSDYLARGIADERHNRISALGGLYNINFELTTDEGLRIAFWGGNNDGIMELLKKNGRPNIIIRNKMHSSAHMENVAEEWVDFLAEANVQLMVPMHHEQWIASKPEFLDGVFNEMNDFLRQKGRVGRIAPMERGRWYYIDLCITEA